MTRKNIILCAYTIVIFLAIWLFLWLQCPQYLLYHERNQLFLFTGSYFLHTIPVPGGMADYISEFVVQFFYVPVYGAMMAALVLSLSQLFLGMACRRGNLSESAFILAALPSLIYLGAMSDENILLSYAVAMMLSSLFIYIYSLFKGISSIVCTISLIIGFAALYWLAGPMAMTFVIASGIICRHPKAIAIGVPVAFAFIWALHSIFFEQYPLSSMLLGINYYRVPEIHPGILSVIAVLIAFFPIVTLPKIHAGRTATYFSAIATAAFAMIYVPASFDKTKSDILSYDSLVRQRKWTDIIEKAQNENPSDVFSLQAVNLALGMTGQLPETMFRYSQNGIEGLIGKNRLDNTSQLISAEALFHLGLTNIAFSKTFDLQESIMNDRKSGRLMKRMAECMIVNGNYKVAAKYLGFLRNSLFYADWARKAETLLWNDNAVEKHTVYGKMRRNAFRKEAFYDHSQIDKILAILAIDSGGENTLAWQYFCAASMLNGNIATLAGIYGSPSNPYSALPIPRHVQEAIAMYWTFNHPTFEGLPFHLNDQVKQQTAALAQAVMKNKDNPASWQNVAPGSYGIYFLNTSLTRQQTEVANEYQHTHE